MSPKDLKEIIELIEKDELDTIISDCEFAGVIDDDDVAEKIFGHTGFGLCERSDGFVGSGHIRFITDSYPFDGGFTELVANLIGVDWADFDDAFADYRI